MTEPVHPPNDMLIAFLNGRLRQRQAEPMIAHLETCMQCAGRLVQLESATPLDSLVKNVRKAVAPEVDDETPFPASGRWPAFLHDHPRFQVQSLLSHGRTGQAYLATDRNTSQRVILKLVQAEPGSQVRLQLLCDRMLAPTHFRVIPTLLVETVGVELLIANKYRSGATLREVICSRGRLTLDETIPFVQQAVESLSHAHSLGITHGDLHPGDWLLDETGIAIRGWDRLRCHHEVTHDPKTDVQGLGRTILGLLVGQSTLTAGSQLPFDELWHDIPKGVIKVLKAATDAEYETPREVAEALMKATSRNTTRQWWQRWFPFGL